MSLQIRTIPTQIGLRTTPPVLEIKQPRGELEVKQQKTELVIEREPVKVHIDQKACFAEYGIKNTVEMVRETAELAKEIAFEEIGHLAQEGDQLAAIENYQGDMFGELAWQRMERFNDHEWNIAFIPEEQPNFEVTGDLKLDWRIIEGFIHYTPRFPEITYYPGQLDIYIQQYGRVEINYVDLQA